MRPNNVNSPMQGQAAVLRVASELIFRGVSVALPCVDDRGVDIYALSGIRIQVKSGYLRFNHRVYPSGAYWFKLSQGPIVTGKNTIRRRGSRKFSEQCDFIVLMGIDESRFWIVPAHLLDNVAGVTVGPQGFFKRSEFEETKTLRKQGLTLQQIADHLGISQVAVSYRLRGGNAKKPQHKTAAVREHENRWDLITGAVATLTEANTIAETAREAVIDREAFLKS